MTTNDYILLHSDYILATFLLQSDCILTAVRIHSGKILTTFWLHSGYISATFRWWVGKGGGLHHELLIYCSR